ncbi:MAG: ATP-dependent 6-phosphofructokinase [Gemmatimonadetes bacterium]|nr:ATP-dependent 6-phosphofructokinase [Gemmatimonadota bacterium]
MRVGVSTGGGDAPGLNAAIRGVVLSALHRDWEVLGIRRGFASLLDGPEPTLFTRADVRGIAHLGGTILGTTNRGNPFRWAETDARGSTAEVDRSDEVIEKCRKLGMDVLILVGGDGTLRIGLDLSRKGLHVVGIPKTIDNDLNGTAASFGFDTAVSIASEAIDRLHSTAESHERVMVVEVMGRNAGWIALHAGLAGGADVILIPEIPFDLESVGQKIQRREREGRRFSIVVVAEGALPRGGSAVIREAAGAGTVERLGGIAEPVARAIAERTGKETRTLTLGHLQRGGGPTTFDRLLALRLGAAAVRAVADGHLETMVSFGTGGISTVPLSQAVTGLRLVRPDSDTVTTARELGISMGD